MEVEKILMERGIRAARSLGQYFLVDDGVAARMVEYAGVGGGDVVLEIGAGVGSVTAKLERKAKNVYAVEKDKELCELLREQYGNKESKTEVMEGDIMKIELPEFDKVVASIPFSLSSPITYKLLLHNFGLAVLLYQKEFAEKMVAPHGSKLYGRLSVIAQALADVEILEFVHRDAFYPSPPVKTAMVRLKEKEKGKEKRMVEKKEKFFEFVTEAFEHRRKKMRNIFKTSGSIALEELEKRPEELSPEEFVRLSTKLLV